MYRMDITHWSVERALFAFAGILTITFSLLALFVHPGFVYGTLFVGGMLSFFALTGYCPAAIVFDKLLNRNKSPR